ncbi:MAG: hypothetical protein IIB59_05590 [Planctomycetes bacterium]|nr:hypothetical protein [Planctomycetota bacterium]
MRSYRKECPEAIRARQTQRVENATRSIVARFECGDLPKTLAPIFLTRSDDLPCRRWSWSNQILTALAGHDDARTFRDWQKVGRCVKKGEAAFYIFEPLTRTRTEKDKVTGEDVKKTWCAGFKPGARFGYEQTDGDELPGREDARRFIDALPLVEVARAWRLTVGTFNGQGARYHGYYRHGQAIALGVENLSTWAHELVHAADDRCGTIEKKSGQVLSNEVVAELGGAVLLTCIGEPSGADVGGAWEYVKAYCDKHDKKPVRVCMQLLNRVCESVALILRTADELAETTGKAVA